MVVEVDPDGVTDPALGVQRRIPETGRETVTVRAMPTLELTLVPFIWEREPDRSIVATVADMAANADAHELLEDARRLLPVANMDVGTHVSVTTSSNSTFSLLQEVRAIRLMEDGSGYWMGMMPGFARWGGRAYVPGWESV